VSIMGKYVPLLALALPLSLLSCAAPAPAPIVHIHSTTSCGCCSEWVQQLRASGIQVEAEPAYDIRARARELGLPEQFQACYVANIEGTFLQGEVPPADIKRVRVEYPDAAGLAVRGLSASKQSAGDHPSDTLLFERDGRVTVFAHHHE